MRRKFLIFLPIALMGLLASAGTASAVPGYPPSSAVTVNISGNNISVLDGTITVVAGGTFTFSGDGFDSGESVGILVSGPSGLRRTTGLSYLNGVAAITDVTANVKGEFAAPMTLEQLGATTLTAVGRTSGKSASLSVTVVAAGSTSGTMVAAVGTGTAAAAGSADGGGLAFTGASLAGPLAIGFVALAAGLALLFFGTSGVRRRRSSNGRATLDDAIIGKQ